jgi:hypothetical protein
MGGGRLLSLRSRSVNRSESTGSKDSEDSRYGGAAANSSPMDVVIYHNRALHVATVSGSGAGR